MVFSLSLSFVLVARIFFLNSLFSLNLINFHHLWEWKCELSLKNFIFRFSHLRFYYQLIWLADAQYLFFLLTPPNDNNRKNTAWIWYNCIQYLRNKCILFVCVCVYVCWESRPVQLPIGTNVDLTFNWYEEVFLFSLSLSRSHPQYSREATKTGTIFISRFYDSYFRYFLCSFDIHSENLIRISFFCYSNLCFFYNINIWPKIVGIANGNDDEFENFFFPVFITLSHNPTDLTMFFFCSVFRIGEQIYQGTIAVVILAIFPFRSIFCYVCLYVKLSFLWSIAIACSVTR